MRATALSLISFAIFRIFALRAFDGSGAIGPVNFGDVNDQLGVRLGCRSDYNTSAERCLPTCDDLGSQLLTLQDLEIRHLRKTQERCRCSAEEQTQCERKSFGSERVKTTDGERAVDLSQQMSHGGRMMRGWTTPAEPTTATRVARERRTATDTSATEIASQGSHTVIDRNFQQRHLH